MKNLKRSVIKEEFIALTSDFKKAVILNQMIYWSERVKDFDKFISEEKRRAEKERQEINIELLNGWIYKTAEELSKETMLGLAPSNVRRHLRELVKKGWLSERTNLNYKWDKTKQYRVNLCKIHEDLKKIGYSLQDYKVSINREETEARTVQNENSNVQNEKSEMQNEKSEMQNRKAIPEITTEITTETGSVISPKNFPSKDNDYNSSKNDNVKKDGYNHNYDNKTSLETLRPKTNSKLYPEIMEFFNTTCKSLPKIRGLSDARKKAINARLKDYSIDTIKEVFQLVEDSDFLSGRENGERQWVASFDWVLNGNNFIKILEGNYVNKKSSQKKKEPEDWRRQRMLENSKALLGQSTTTY